MNQPVTHTPQKQIGSRIKKLRQEIKLTQRDFSELLGLSQGALSQIENGHYYPSIDSLLKLTREYNLNFNWLMNGIGAMFTENRVFRDARRFSQQVGLVDIEAHAGYVKQLKDPEYLRTLKLYEVPGFRRDSQKSYRLFQVEGDSMQPTLWNEDFVLCERIKPISDTANGSVGVVITSEEILVKRIYFDAIDTSFAVLKSDNKNYRAISLPTEEIQEIWRVIRRITSKVDQDLNMTMSKIEALEQNLTHIRNQIDRLTEDRGENP